MNIFTRNFLLFCLLLIPALGCKKSSDANTVGVDNSVPATLTVSTWKITAYGEGGDDKAPTYKNITFTFETSGLLSAGNGNDITTGSWSFSKLFHGVQVDIGSVKINLGNSSLYNRLGEEWKVLTISPTKIVLTNESDANGDHLELSRL